MKLEDAVSKPYSSPIELDEEYLMKITIEGFVQYYKPVDFRTNMIHIPLRTGDIRFIYDKTSTSTNVYKNDVITKWYYPPSTSFTLMDGTEVTVLSYGPVKYYKGMAHIDVVCKLTDETKTIIETIPNGQIMDKVLTEMNKILISNEELKSLLPQYSYNWMLYTDTEVDDVSLFKASEILDYIDLLEYQEYYIKQNHFKSVLEENYTSIPNSIINEIYSFSKDYIKPKYPIYYNKVTKSYKMKAIANWLLYKTDNFDKDIDYTDIYLINKYGNKTHISITSEDNTIVGKDIIYKLEMPDDSRYNYRIELTQVTRYLEYVSYNIDTLKLIQINKDTEEEKELSHASEQSDNFDAFVAVLEILSAYNIDCSITEYYDKIDELISNLDTSENYLEKNEPGDEATDSSEDKENVNSENSESE